MTKLATLEEEFEIILEDFTVFEQNQLQNVNFITLTRIL